MNKRIVIYYQRLLIAIVSVLVLIGLLFVYSSSSVFALERFGSSFYFLKKQIYGLLIGIIGIVFLQAVSATKLKKLSPLLFLLSLIATALTLFSSFGQRIHGSSRWLSIGGFSLQPSELLKIFFIIYFAYVLSKKSHKYSFLSGYLPMLIIVLIPGLVLLRQPDFGLSVTLCLTAITMMFFAQFRLTHILLTIASLLPIGAILILLKPY